jgi:hypothetical protein
MGHFLRFLGSVAALITGGFLLYYFPAFVLGGAAGLALYVALYGLWELTK